MNSLNKVNFIKTVFLVYYFIQPEPVLLTLAHFLLIFCCFHNWLNAVKQLFWKDPLILIFIDIYEHVLDIFIRFTERLALGICFNDAQCLKMLMSVVVFLATILNLADIIYDTQIID